MLSPMATCNSYSSSSSSSSGCKRPRTSSLPLDLLHNVFSRLPTISLLKLRSVCREWRDVIDGPRFAAMHATSGIESPRILLLSGPSCSAERLFAADNEFLVTSFPKSVTRPWLCRGIASCHGLLCFDDHCDCLTYLLNPLTQEIISLWSVDPSHHRWGLHMIGIGVDRLTSRYKIVRVSHFFDRQVCPTKAEVLDQGSRSWRDIASVPSSLLLGVPVFVAGSIHWITNDRGGAVRISSFDIAKEEFTRTPCPELQHANLVDLQGVLGLVDRSREESMDVWAMEESGRWVKEYSVRLSSLPVGIRLCLDVVGCVGRKIALNYSERFWIYDPGTDELKHVQRAGDVVGSIAVSLLSPAKLWHSGVAEISPE